MINVDIDKERIADRILDSKGRASLKEFADPGDKVELAILDREPSNSEDSDNKTTDEV